MWGGREGGLGESNILSKCVGEGGGAAGTYRGIEERWITQKILHQYLRQLSGGSQNDTVRERENMMRSVREGKREREGERRKECFSH